MPARRPGASGRRALSALIVLAAMLLMMVPGPVATAEEGGDVVKIDPVRIFGDEMLDRFFGNASSDGLTPGTAHVLEGITISSAGGWDSCIYIQDTTRHLVIRNSTLYEEDISANTSAILIRNSSNVSIVDCLFPGSRKAITVVEGEDLVIEGNRVTGQRSHGIQVERSQRTTVSDNKVEHTDKGILVHRSDNVTVLDNVVSTNVVGIDVSKSDHCMVRGNEVKDSYEDGIKVSESGDVLLSENHVHGNRETGIHVTLSEVVTVDRNIVESNYRGVLVHRSDECMLVWNNVSRNAVVGIRFQHVDDSTIGDNRIRSNWNLGIDLFGSDDNVISGNRVVGHGTGINIVESRDNLVEGNSVLGNRWAGIDGDVDGNTVRDNDMRANGWLRGLFLLVMVLAVLGVVMGVHLSVKRRRRTEEEKGRVLIRRRFPAGTRGLWPMSKVMWDEDFFRAQLNAAGPQREDILRRYQNSIAAARQMQYMSVGIMAVMLAFMASIPLIGVLNVYITDVGADNFNDVLFASSMSIAVYYLLSFMVLLVFGLLFTTQLVRGEMFKLISTLPVDRKGARRIVAYLLLRMYGPPLVVVLLAFPVGGFLITLSVPFLLTALLVNVLYIALVSYLLVIIADATSRRVFSSAASRGATVMRFVVMGGYLISMMFIFLVLQFLVGYITELFEAAKLAGGSGEAINMGVSMVPFPFSGAYLVSMTLLPGEHISAPIVASIVVGMAIMGALVWWARRKGNRILARVAMGVEMTSGGAGQTTTVEQVTVATRPPVSALARNSLLVSSHDQGAVMYLIMPIVFPFISFVTMILDEDISTFAPLIPYLSYLGITPFLVNLALSTADANVGGLLGSLPFRTLDQYRAKWVNMVTVMMVPLLVIVLILYPRVDEANKMAALMLSIAPLIMVVSSLFLITFSFAFGTVNGRRTFFMANIRGKFAKYVGIVALQYAIIIGELGSFWVMTRSGVISFEAGIVFLAAVNTTLFVVLELMARRSFQ